MENCIWFVICFFYNSKRYFFLFIFLLYIQGAHGIALVYDVTDRKTLDNIDYWLGNIKDNAQEEVEQVLIANKVDLPRAINEEEGNKVASDKGVRYLETSAKTGSNVRSAFYDLASRVVEKNGAMSKNNGVGTKLIKLDNKDKIPKKKKPRCIIS